MDSRDVEITAVTASVSGTTVPRPRSAGGDEDDESRLLGLLERWHEGYLRNDDPTPEDLGVKDPVLRESLREEIRRHKRLFDALGLPQAPSPGGTGDVWNGADLADALVANPNPAGPVQRIGRYQVLGALGRGGQGDVFRALHPELSKVFVLKVARRRAGADPAERGRMLREGQLLAGCDHPNFVRVIDLDFHEGRPFVVMEHVHGLNLEQFAALHRPTQRQIARLVADLCRAVAYVHRRGILHLDITPRNVLVDEAGRPRLIDFGLARLRHAWAEDADGSSGGTTCYMSPEQAHGDEDRIGPCTDVFGLGGVLYFLLTSRPVYQDTSVLGTLQLAMAGEQVSPRRVNPSAGRRLERICMTALSPDPARRYRSAGEVEQALRHFVGRPCVIASAAAVLGLSAVAIMGLRHPAELQQSTAKRARAAISPGPAPEVAVIPRVLTFDVKHYRGEKPPESLGAIGVANDRILLDDDVRVSAHLNVPSYCYLVALRPDGEIQLCHPSSPSETPLRSVDITYPTGNLYFPLIDGVGLHAFVLMASRNPLPPFNGWDGQNELGWETVQATGVGVWGFDGQTLEPLSGDRRGQPRAHSGPPGPFERVCKRIRKRPDVDAVRAIAFPVVKPQ